MSNAWGLPEFWVLTNVAEVCDFHAGFGFPTEMQGIAGQALPFYKVKDVSVAWYAKSMVLLDTEHSLSHDAADRIKAKPIPAGVVVFAKIGEALRLNRRAIVPRPSLIDNNLMGISAPPTRLATRYLYWFSLVTKFDVDARASVVPSIRKSDVGNLPFPLPPLAEQTRIVEKLEELLSGLDAGVAELKAAQKKLGQYRQSLLKAAVEGALTADWRAAQKVGAGELPPETGAQLLARILQERRARWEAKQLAKFASQGKTPPKDWQKKYPEPVQPDTSDLPELPEGWVWASVAQLGEVQLGRQRSPDKMHGICPVRYIRAANITELGIDFSDVLEMDFNDNERETFALKAGDVLLTEASGSPEHVGRPVIWPEVEGLFCFQNTVLRFTPHGISSAFAYRLFHAWQKLGVFSKLSGGVGINHLSAGKFSMLAVPLPSIEEQKACVHALELAFATLTEQTQCVQQSLKQSAAQRKNILKAAFSGQLVPQDPNDEPASRLLERIRAERAVRDATKKPRGRKVKDTA